MAYERTLTPKSVLNQFSDLPVTLDAYQKYAENRSLDLFSIVAKACIAELSDKSAKSFTIPKDILLPLISILETMEAGKSLELYIPCLNLFQLVLSLCTFAIPSSLVTNLCKYLSDIQTKQPNIILINTTFAVVDTLYHLALSRRKKSDSQDSSWPQKIFTSFLMLLSDLSTNSSIKEIAVAEYSGNSVRISPESQVVKTNTHTDLILYICIALSQLGKMLTPSISNEVLLKTLPGFFNHIIAEFSYSSATKYNKDRLYINLEKSISGIKLLSIISALTAKQDNGKVFIKTQCDKIKSLVFYTVLEYFKNSLSVTSEAFEDDESALGRLFNELYELFSSNLLHTDLETYPVLIFAVMLQPEIVKAVSGFSCVQAYTLQVLNKYIKLMHKKNKLNDSGLVELMFSDAFFQIESNTALGNSACSHWNGTWKLITEAQDNLDWISSSVVRQIKLNQGDLGYLRKMNSWIHEQFEANTSTLELFIQNGLLEEMLRSVVNINDTGANIEFITEFFVMVKSIIYMCDINIPVPVSEKLVDLMLKEALIYNPYLSELTLSCLVLLIRYQDLPSYSKYLDLLKNSKDFQVTKILLQSIQHILKDSNTTKVCQESFIQAGIMALLKDILRESYKETFTVSIWVSTLECVRFLIQDNDYCKENLSQIDFKYLSSLLSSENFQTKVKKISKKCIEVLLYILFDSTYLDILYDIITPKVVPLLLVMLCQEYSNFNIFFLNCLDSEYNCALLSLNSATEVLLDCLIKSELQETSNFIYKVLTKVIQYHVSPLDMKKIIATGCKLPQSKQLNLFKCINQTIEKTFFLVPNANPNMPKYRNHLSNYTWFRNPSDNIHFLSDVYELLPKKDFTIILWVFSINSDKGCLMDFTDGRSQFTINLCQKALEVVLTTDKKNIFRVTTHKVLPENQWNFICIGFQQISKIIGNVYNLDIFVNAVRCDKNVEGKIGGISYNFSSLFLGNSFDLKCNFQGKISMCYICNKIFNDPEPIYSLFEYSYLAFIPQSNLGFYGNDKKDYKELSKSKHFEYMSFYSDLSESITVKPEAFVFNSANILNALNAIGGLQAILPIFQDSCMEHDIVIEILKFVNSCCKTYSMVFLLPKHFFEIFAVVIESNITPTHDLLTILKELLENLEWNPDTQNKVFKNLMLNTKIWANGSGSLTEEYLNSLCDYVSKHFECRLDDCVFLYSHLIAINPSPGYCFVQIFCKILPKRISVENLDGIAYVLFKMINDSPEAMQLFLEELSLIKIDKDCTMEFMFFIIHYMEWNQGFSVQAGCIRVLKPILISLIESNPDPKKKINKNEIVEFIFVSIDKKLERSISIEIFQALMDIILFSFNFTDKKTGSFFAMFIDIITKRYSFLTENIKNEMIKATSDYQFCSLIAERETFLSWFIESYDHNPNSILVIGQNIFSYSTQKFFIEKLRAFLVSVSRHGFSIPLQFYKSILDRLILEKQLNEIQVFLDFISILEDLLNPDWTGRNEFDADAYGSIIEAIIQHGIDLSVIHCTYPPIPRMDFSNQYELLKQKPIDLNVSEESIYLREGGFLRMVLKYILIGISAKPSGSLLAALRTVLAPTKDSSVFIQLNSLQKQASDKILSECITERYSLAYSKFPSRENDVFFTEEFLSIYIMAELTEVLNVYSDGPMASLMSEFLQTCTIDKVLTAWSKKITSKELEDFYKMLKDFKFYFFATARFRYPQMERNSYLQLMATVTPVNLATFQSNVSEQVDVLLRSKRSESSLKSLLTSNNWIIKIHFFLLAYTSMKLNYIAGMVKPPASIPKKVSYELELHDSLNTELSAFVSSKQEDLKVFSGVYTSTQEKFKLIYKQKFCSIIETYKKIDRLFNTEKIKLRSTCDVLGRMGVCSGKKNPEKISLKKRDTVSIPVDSKFKASVLITTSAESSVNDSIDESEIGTVLAGPDEENPENVPTPKQKNIRIEAERIKIAYSLFGEIEISQTYVLFVSDGKEKPSDGKYIGSALKFTQETKKSAKYIETSEILEVFPRRFIHKNTGFEIYLNSGRSYYFNVFTQDTRDSVFDIMKSWKNVKLMLDTTNLIKSYTKKWKKCLISNLEYLLVLNKFASRSFNDISQYPVFPWVLKDYYSSDIKLEDPHIYRNFKLPIGAQTDQGRQEAERRYSMLIDEQPYHFGSHYSSGAIVLHYLVRLEPFSTQAKILQGGKFDIADRLFHSIQASWESGQGINGDVKELIPELFYLPEVFININNEELGHRQDDEEVSSVELPRWATSPFDFVRKHRQALESNYTSQNLNHWIDIIFGYKQKGKQAQNSYNLFCPMTYEENFNKFLESSENNPYLQGIIDQVVHFGQTPIKLFKSPHAVRDVKPLDQNIFDKYRKFPECISNGCETNGEIYAILATPKFLLLVKNVNNRMSLIRITLNELDSNRVVFEKKKEKFLTGSRPAMPSSEKYYCVWGDRLVSGYQTDKSFKVHSLNGNLEASVHSHTGMVTSVWPIGAILVTGSSDTSIYSWQEKKSKDKNLKISYCNTYLGHTSQIAQIAGIEQYQLLISLNEEGIILIHDLRSADCIKGIKSKAASICSSNLGIIAAISPDDIVFYSFNGTVILKHKAKVHKAIFDNTGENLYYFYDKTWGFTNLFDENKKFEKTEEFYLMHLQLPIGNEYLIHSQIGDNSNFVFTFELVSKDSLRIIPRHNVLRD